MDRLRRRFLQLAAGAGVLPSVTRLASAPTYPMRPVRIIVGFAAGGNSDIFARLFGQWLSERLGQPFIVENRPGAGTTLATEAVVKAAPDGYTLLLFSSSTFLAATLYDKVNFSFVRDIAPVASISRGAYVMLINPSVPAGSIPEFVAYAKANPGKVTMASAGIGSGPHVTGELFKTMTGIDMVHVPYRGDPPALTDLIGGQVQVYFGTVSASIEYVRSGKLRALAVTTAARLSALPEIPTVGEFLPGYEASLWTGFGAPKDTPAEIVELLNKEINAALVDPKIRARVIDLGATAHASSPADYGKLIAAEVEKLSKVIRAANIKPE